MTKAHRPCERISGDGLTLKFNSNYDLLEISGDGCRISLSKNYGRVLVNGDGCRLIVYENLGTIEYVGDGGRLFIGADSLRDKVVYIGDGGLVTFDATEVAVQKKKSNSTPLRVSQPRGEFADEPWQKRGSTKGTTTKSSPAVTKTFLNFEERFFENHMTNPIYLFQKTYNKL